MIKNLKIISLFGLLLLSTTINGLTSTTTSSTSSTSSNGNGNLSPIQDYDFEFLVKHLTTKTPYWRLTENGDSNSSGDSSESSESNDIPPPSPTCKLLSIDFLARHGSRLPVQSSILKLKQMTTDIFQYKQQVNNGFKWIFNYTVPYPTDIAGNLILQGQFEHYNISKRLLGKYSEYFESMSYKPQSYQISSTLISRTGISASAFSYGLLEGTGQLGDKFQPVFVQTASLDQDKLLRFFSTCKTYTTMVSDGTINKNEQTQWNNMKYPNISIEISQRLGLSDIWEPTISVVDDIFSACAYEISINNITDHWCGLLSRQNILDYEYSQDLSNYWIKSFGNKVNYEIASELLQAVINNFDKYIVNSKSVKQDGSTGSNSDSDNSGEYDIVPQPTTLLRFGHAETVIPFISLLGLYKDDQHLYANSTDEQIENRKFRTSVVSPYASNIGMFLFDCGCDDSSDSGNGNFKILVEHNELPVLIPGCDEIYCDYQQFKSLFPNVVSFDWHTYCNLNSSHHHQHGSGSSGSNGGNDNGSTSPSSSSTVPTSGGRSPMFLAMILPITFLIGGSIGGLLIWISYEKIKHYKNRNNNYFDELSTAGNFDKNSKFNVNSPLIN